MYNYERSNNFMPEINSKKILAKALELEELYKVALK